MVTVLRILHQPYMHVRDVWDMSPLTIFNYVKLHSESNPSKITKSQPMSELGTLANIVDCFPM